MIPRSTSSGKYPQFIRENEVVKKFASQGTVFPKIGLTNSKGSFSPTRYFSDDDLLVFLHSVATGLIGHKNLLEVQVETFLLTRNQIDCFCSISGLLIHLLSIQTDKFIVRKNGLIKLALPSPIKSNYRNFNSGTDLFTVISYLKDNCNFPIIKEQIQFFLKQKQLLNNNYQIVFSGSGNKGLWDIATMSMRGIKSCQRWGSSYAKALVGSMVDPYAGIIYLTDGEKMKHGPKMVTRSVVRFVVNRHTNEPAIMLERIYPNLRNYYTSDDLVGTAFKKFIKDRVCSKYKVFYINSRSDINNGFSAVNYFIPLTPAVDMITEQSGQRSYRDSAIGYANWSS